MLHRPLFGLSAGLALLGATLLLVFGVGSQADRVAPATAFPPIGHLDQATYDAVQQIRNPVLSFFARVLNIMGGAAIGISLVIAFLPAGHRRRVWEWMAAGFAFLMGLSRVYLNAHWLSDATTGVFLGAGVALTVAAVVALLDRRIEGETPADEIERDDPDEAVPTGA